MRGGSEMNYMPLPLTAADRARLERDLDMAITLRIALLDAEDALGDDLEPDDEGCCEAGDDDPASSRPFTASGVRGEPGDPADAEKDGDEDEPSDANDYMGHLLVTVHGGVPA